MPVVQVQLPDGRIVPVEVPDSPAAQQEATKSSLSGLKDAAVSGGKSLARGFLGGLAGLAEGAAAFNFADRMGRTPTPGREMTAGVEKMLPTPKEESTFEKLSRKGLEGVGGAFAAPVPGAMAANAIAGGVGGVTGELGRSFGERAGPIGEVAGQVAGGALGGGLAGFVAGPKQSVAQADIRRQGVTITPQEWAESQKRAQLLQAVGSKTATAADAMPPGSGLRVLAQGVINREGGETLAAKVGPRFEPGGDIAQLGDNFLNSLAPRIEPATVANQLSDAGNSYMKNLNQLATTGVSNRLQGKTLRAVDVEMIYNQLMDSASRAQKTQPSLVPVYEEVAKQLLQGGKGPRKVITDLQGLSFQLKNLKDSPAGLEASAGTKGQSAMWQKAIKEAETLLAQRSPDWKAAMEDFAAFKAGPGSDAKTGAIRLISDANPNLETPTRLSKPEAFVSGYDPTTIAGNAKMLADPNMTQGATVDGNVVARALATQRLRSGDMTNPGKTMRGQAGGIKEQELLALAPKADLRQLEAADLLQGLKPKSFNQENIPEMRWWQSLIRPFRTLDMMLTLKNERGIAQEVARLFQDPANIPQLQKIAMFDPSVRKQLTLLGAMRPMLPGNTSQEQ